MDSLPKWLRVGVGQQRPASIGFGSMDGLLKRVRGCLLLLFLLTSFKVDAMQSNVIIDGITDYRVYQRDDRGEANMAFRITASFATEMIIKVRLLDGGNGRILRDWQEVGRLKSGYLNGALSQVPVGGPYTIQFQILEPRGKVVMHQQYEQMLVGDLWILAGQSNMEGLGELVDAEEPSILVHTYGMDEQWNIAVEPLHWLLDSIDPVHHRGLSGAELERQRLMVKAMRTTGAGLGLPFAKTLVKATGTPIGLIPCAHGGTSMEQWNPEKKELGGASLYGSMYRRFLAAGGKVRGVLWYQGEAECNSQAAPLYTERMRKFVSALRRDFNDPNLPFFLVQLGRYITDSENPSWSDIREKQRRLPELIPSVRVVAAIDLPMDDAIHVGTEGHKRLGRRLAQLVLRDLFGRKEILAGPSLVNVTMRPGLFPIYRLSFDQVNGRLQAAGRVSGFSLRDRDGRELPLIFKSIITADGQAIDIYLRQSPPADAVLYYGYGVDPYCNVTDQLDMAMPAFGPVYIDQAGYDAFMLRAKENPRDAGLIGLLPQAISILHRKPEYQSELLAQVQTLLKNFTANDRIKIYPYLFALGDFQYWQEWLNAVRRADLNGRKQMASAWVRAADFPVLPCPFVKNYLIVGPFDNTEDKGFDRVYSPEKQTALDAVFTDAIGGQAVYKPAQSAANGFLDFLPQFDRQENVVAYALVRVLAADDVEIPILLGSDDAAAVWVNGEEIYREHIHRGAQPAQNLMLASFKKGENRLLVKVDQGGGDWGLFLQLVDKDRKLKVL